jgi:hypothetical protein
MCGGFRVAFVGGGPLGGWHGRCNEGSEPRESHRMTGASRREIRLETRMFKLVAVIVAMAMLALAPASARASSTLRLEGTARSSNPSLKFNARYEEEAGRNRQRFDVQIENVRPGSKHMVLANGKPMGTITANQFGRGEMHLRVNWDGSNVPSLPHFKAGAVVTVDKLSTTLVAR